MLVIGFFVGASCCISISAIIATFQIGDGTLHICDPAFEAWVGNPLLAFFIQQSVSGVFTAVMFGGTVFYEIEEWSLLRATIMHCVFGMIAFFTTAFSLRWLDPSNVKKCMIVLILWLAGFFLVWLSFYLSYKAEIRKINEELMDLKNNR